MMIMISLMATFFCGSASAYSPLVVIKTKSTLMTTTKVAHISNHIDMKSYSSFNKEMSRIKDIKEPLVIVINSNGGYESYGTMIIATIEEYKVSGNKVICFGENSVSSMAFNIMSHCDTRIMSADTRSLVHKVARESISIRMTARNLRRAANELDATDEPHRVLNAKKMKLSLEQYDSFADSEKEWTAEELLKIEYLDDIGSLEK